jgi:hypothetical protein
VAGHVAHWVISEFTVFVGNSNVYLLFFHFHIHQCKLKLVDHFMLSNKWVWHYCHRM